MRTFLIGLTTTIISALLFLGLVSFAENMPGMGLAVLLSAVIYGMLMLSIIEDKEGE